MKLLYPRFINGNFGDELNSWLWSRLLPDIKFDDDDRVRVMGIGSGLSPKLWRKQPLSRYVVLGSGAGYSHFKFSLGRRFPLLAISLEKILSQEAPLQRDWLPPSSKIYWVRGPLTVKLLKLDPALACGDPVTYLNRFVEHSNSPRAAVAYMPHFRSSILTEIELLCAEAGIAYIDPCAGIEPVMAQLQNCQLLITEALHGAIAADAFRIPWIPVVTSSLVLDFKWRDYCMQMELDYQPHCIPPVWRIEEILRDKKCDVPYGLRLPTRVRGWVANCGQRKRAVQQLKKLSGQRPCLASDSVVARAQERMEEALALFRNDVHNGFWNTRS